ncbi:hypothetical protein [Planotetraspora sp. GP83]|uniref:hypothetical protein n=1 Tax=Planotetraspora sp. GP83 TaxID=3156264 RepID=UPI003512CCA6
MPGGFAGGRRTHAGQLVAVGLAGVLIGAILGGGVVAVGGALWNRVHGHYYRVSYENQDPRAGRGPWERPFGRRFGEDIPPGVGQLPRFCQRTDTGFRCDMPGPGSPMAPSAPTPPTAPKPLTPIPSPTS